MNEVIEAEIDGLGFVLYSPFAVKKIKEGEDFFSKYLLDAHSAGKMAEECKIVPFCTGSPGNYTIRVLMGLPTDEQKLNYDYRLQVGLIVRDNELYIRDVYDLMDWTKECGLNQRIEMESGFYIVTLLTSVPQSGIIGDNQIIDMFFHKLNFFPAMKHNGVPFLGKLDEECI